MSSKNAKIGDLAARYIGAALQYPEQRPQILKRAAKSFMGLSADPRNARIAQRLHWYAQEFARASERPATVDDFADMLREKAEAYSEIEDQNSDIDLVAREREIHEARSGGLGRTSIAPRSLNETTAFGRVVRLKWHPTPDDAKNNIVETDTVSQWQGDKTEAQAVTVSAGVVTPAAAIPNSMQPPGARPYGQISFGSDGTVVTVKFDIGRGVRFTVACNFITVLVGMEAPAPSETINAPMSVGVSLGMFAAPSLAPVFRTVYLDSLLNGATSDIFPIPPGAVQLYTPMCSAAAGTSVLELFDVSQTVLAGKINLTNGVPVMPIPLPGDAVFFRITNNSGANADYRFPFQLSL